VPYDEVRQVAEAAIKYGFICAFAMPCATKMMKEYLAGSGVRLGGVAGFPSGADTMEQKVDCAKYMASLGCDEIDMVINVGALISDDADYVEREISAVVDAVTPIPVKSILECTYLDERRIRRACEAAVSGGAAFVKSGTGWAAEPTTVEMVRIMKSAVGDRVTIKAAGGVRSLAILEDMYEAGCRRFGISLASALKIMKESYERDGVPYN
jgi:deoxyribose-phosphate aldolase